MNFKFHNSLGCWCVLLAFFSFLMIGCSTASTTSTTPTASNTNKAHYDYYTVQPNDTLSSIAKKFNADPNAIIANNNLHSPYTMQIGQRLRIPIKIQKDLAAEAKAANWAWPTKGKIVKTFSEGNDSSRGIDIAGQSGQSIVASVSGKVVYSGAGLDNYGNSIIIKYNENFLAVYGFVKDSLVKEGEIVSQGEKIAEMGANSKGHAILHFEIRENGKTVDPLRYLKVQ